MRSAEVGFSLGDNLHVGDSIKYGAHSNGHQTITVVSACHSSFYQCVNEHCLSLSFQLLSVC